MRFLFPAIRHEPCEEINAWRFQRCEFCGWTGDAATGIQYDIGRDIWEGYRVNGTHYETLKDFLLTIDLCR
jgi:hypothetical protein